MNYKQKTRKAAQRHAVAHTAQSRKSREDNIVTACSVYSIFIFISATIEASSFRIWYTTWVWGVAYQERTFRTKTGGVWAKGAPQKFWDPYSFLQPLKLATSNLPPAHTPTKFSPKSCFGNVLLEPKLCTKFEVTSFNGCKNKQRVPIFLVAPLIPDPANFGPKSYFVKLLRKPKLYTKFEVVRFNSCQNKQGQSQNFWDAPLAQTPVKFDPRSSFWQPMVVEINRGPNFLGAPLIPGPRQVWS